MLIRGMRECSKVKISLSNPRGGKIIHNSTVSGNKSMDGVRKCLKYRVYGKTVTARNSYL